MALAFPARPAPHRARARVVADDSTIPASGPASVVPSQRTATQFASMTARMRRGAVTSPASVERVDGDDRQVGGLEAIIFCKLGLQVGKLALQGFSFGLKQARMHVRAPPAKPDSIPAAKFLAVVECAE